MTRAGYVDVWVNCPDEAVAEAIARMAVEERLAACANILAPVTSLYRWQGVVERTQEVPLLLKTRASLFGQVSARVKAMHPYAVPSILAMEIVAIEPAYAEWIGQETLEP